MICDLVDGPLILFRMIIAPLPGPIQALAWAAILLGLGVALMASLGAGLRNRALRAPAAVFGLSAALGGVARTPLMAPGSIADAVSLGSSIVGLIAVVLLFRRATRSA